jgi:perosamine synthetase
MKQVEEINQFVREHFNSDEFIPLHEPRFRGNEKEYLSKCIDSTFVSYLGEFVPKLENMFKEYTGAKYALAVCNGTAALHMALLGSGVKKDDEVITQGLSFVATANAIAYCDASPIFLDIEKKTLGLSYIELRTFLENNTITRDGVTYNKNSGKRISACVPVHIFGHPVKDIDLIASECEKYNISLVEDSAESLGSFYKEKHTGRFGDVGVFSFNGNKIVTSGGGGMVLTDDEEIYNQVRHISTTAKIPHKWEYDHDEIGFNLRMPNLNAAVACAQMENLETYLVEKRELADKYKSLFRKIDIDFFEEKANSTTNYWLNAIFANDKNHRDQLLEGLNAKGIMSRPAWKPLNELSPYKDCQSSQLTNVKWFTERIINIPSSARAK